MLVHSEHIVFLRRRFLQKLYFSTWLQRTGDAEWCSLEPGNCQKRGAPLDRGDPQMLNLGACFCAKSRICVNDEDEDSKPRSLWAGPETGRYLMLLPDAMLQNSPTCRSGSVPPGDVLRHFDKHVHKGHSKTVKQMRRTSCGRSDIMVGLVLHFLEDCWTLGKSTEQVINKLVMVSIYFFTIFDTFD